MRPFTWLVPYTVDNVPPATVVVEEDIGTDGIEYGIDVLDDLELHPIDIKTPTSCKKKKS